MYKRQKVDWKSAQDVSKLRKDFIRDPTDEG